MVPAVVLPRGVHRPAPLLTCVSVTLGTTRLTCPSSATTSADVVVVGIRRVDEHYERMRARLLVALADHERGELDDAGLQAAVNAVRDALDHAHTEVRESLFEADVALEYAQYGRPADGSDPRAALKRVRRNLREVLG